jgi:hypothetical protein
MFVQMTRDNLLYYKQVNVVFVNIKVEFSIFYGHTLITLCIFLLLAHHEYKDSCIKQEFCGKISKAKSYWG